MSHSHAHVPTTETKNIKLAFFLNFGFAILELIGGLLTNSLAVFSSGLHDLSDSGSLGLAWFLSKISTKSRDAFFTYGYKRFSVLSALITGLVLLGVSFFLYAEALRRILHPEHSNAQGMLIFGILAIVINGIAVLRLRTGKTLNERVAMWHLLDDVLGGTSVILISIIMQVWDIHILDPIFSILFSTYFLWNVIKNLKETVMIFLQGVPSSMNVGLLEEKIIGVPSVESVHDTHIWSLDGESHILSTHIVLKPDCSLQEATQAKCQVKAIAVETHIHHATVELEWQGEECHLRRC